METPTTESFENALTTTTATAATSTDLTPENKEREISEQKKVIKNETRATETPPVLFRPLLVEMEQRRRFKKRILNLFFARAKQMSVRRYAFLVIQRPTMLFITAVY